MIEDAGGGGAFVCISFDVKKAYGKKRVKVKADIEGETYHSSLVRIRMASARITPGRNGKPRVLRLD